MIMYTVIGRRQKFPVRVYTDRQGLHQPLGQARSFIFTFVPDKAGVFYLNVHVTDELVGELLRRSEWVEDAFFRLAAKATEAWLREEVEPGDPHFNGQDTLLVDQRWYPRGPNGEPLLADQWYYFHVETAEAEPAPVPWWLKDDQESG